MVSNNRKILGALSLVAILAVGVLACGADDAGAPTNDTTTDTTPTGGGGTSLPFSPEPLDWKSCNGVECAELRVPYDYFAQPSATFTLKIARQRALDPERRVGVLLVNPGGPGAPGISLAQNAAYFFSREVIERFDIVAWDPRGTGASSPAVDCIDDYDDYFTAPLTAETGQRFVDACNERSGEILPHIGTINSARDIEAIRRALGEERVSYFGFSYGGLLGLVWKSMFPDTARAVVLDAPVSPIASRSERIASQAAGFEQLLTEFLARNDLTGRWEAVTSEPPEGMTPHMLLAAAVSALYDEESWPQLADALRKAAEGDPSGVRAMYDGYFYQDEGFEDFRNTFEASIAIACVDDTQNVPLGDVTTFAPRLAQFFSPEELCSRWPVRSTETYVFRSGGSTPTVIIGATEDPASPFVGVQAAASVAGDVRLVTVEGRRHTSYLQIDCVTKLVDDYLIDLAEVPNTTCDSPIATTQPPTTD